MESQFCGWKGDPGPPLPAYGEPETRYEKGAFRPQDDSIKNLAQESALMA